MKTHERLEDLIRVGNLCYTYLMLEGLEDDSRKKHKEDPQAHPDVWSMATLNAKASWRPGTSWSDLVDEKFKPVASA